MNCGNNEILLSIYLCDVVREDGQPQALQEYLSGRCTVWLGKAGIKYILMQKWLEV